jgi:hypothetical protein
VKGEFSTLRKLAGVFQGPVLAPTLYNLYTNDASAAPGTHLALFADDTCIYATRKHESRVLCKLKRGLTAVNSWFERWNITIDEGKIQAIYLSKRLRVPEEVLQLNGQEMDETVPS